MERKVLPHNCSAPLCSMAWENPEPEWLLVSRGRRRHRGLLQHPRGRIGGRHITRTTTNQGTIASRLRPMWEDVSSRSFVWRYLRNEEEFPKRCQVSGHGLPKCRICIQFVVPASRLRELVRDSFSTNSGSCSRQESGDQTIRFGVKAGGPVTKP